MPIKMTGSVRPTSLTSPDPISMPIINKLPALKAKVIDIRDNGPGTPTVAWPGPSGPSPYTAGQFVDTDWKIVGDTHATLDTNTGLEWLDLSETRGESYTTVLAGLESDGTFEGWRLPTVNELNTLMNTFFPTANGGPGVYVIDDSSVAELGAYAGHINGSWSSGNVHQSYGYTAHPTISGGLTIWGAETKDAGPDSWVYFGNYHSGYNQHYANASPNAGFWLVSDGGTTLSSIANPNINQPGT